MRLLLVEDHPCTRLAFSRLLSRCGIDVFACDSAEAAEILLSSQPFDVALIDCRLPGKPGTDLVASLLAQGTDTRLVLMSAEDDYRKLARTSCPGIPFLRKPIPPESLMSTVLASSQSLA